MKPLLLRVLATILIASGVVAQARAAVVVTSPNARAAIALSLSRDGVPFWSVSWRGQPVLDRAPIGLRFADRARPVLRLTGLARHRHNGMVSGLVGKASSARDRYTEAVLTLAGDAMPLQLVLRAYDDGVAYRWRFRTPGAFALADEDAGFGVPAAAQAWIAPAHGFTSSHEEYYRTGLLNAAAPDGSLLTLPMLVRRGSVWAGMTEAALHDWAGLSLVRHDGQPGLGSRLSPRLDRAGIAVVGGAGAHVSPWRVVMLGDAPGRLVESNLVTLLNPPPLAQDWSWVHPGKTSFPWWNDYVWPGQHFAPGLNTATLEAYIDFDADHGIPYHTLDGFEDQAWYPGPIQPDGSVQDLTRARPAIDMAEVLDHARRRGVKLRLWCHWVPLHAQLDAALDQWQKWGVEGLMVDFMDRDDQEMVAFYDEIARKAATHHLTVVYHGAYKPTGENRTWPNVLSREAVRGTEYNKFADNPGSTPLHETTIPFTRMLAGPMDTHEGGFDAASPESFRSRFSAPQVIGTRARALAIYVVQENGLPMVADTPANYNGATGFDFVAQTPATWDETRVLAGKVGEYVVVARRKGAQWWLGAMNDGQARRITVRLPPRRAGAWALDGYADGDERNAARHLTARVDPRQPLVLHLVAAGGYAARLSPVN